MSLAVVVVWALLQAWFGFASDRVSITVHSTLESCELAKQASDASSAVCLGPYEKAEAER